MADSTIGPKIQKTNGGDLMTVASGGQIKVESGGKLTVGTVDLPALPTDDGVYELTIASGVASWTAAT